MTNISPHIIKVVAFNLGWREQDPKEPIEPYLEQIKAMSPRQIFDQYCVWYGVGFFSEKLWNAAEELRKAEVQ